MTETHEYNVQDDPASADTTTLGVVGAHLYDGAMAVRHVVVEQTNAADADWNVQVDGSDLFDAEQSVDSADTVEVFEPDQNEHFSDPSKVAVDVSSAGSAGNLNVSVVLEEV